MMYRLLISITCVLFLIAGCAGKRADATDLESLIENGALIVDVRTEQEFNAGHYESAINIPYGEILDKLGDYVEDKDRAIILYCRTGNRSGIAYRALKQEGYTNLYSVANQRQLPSVEK